MAAHAEEDVDIEDDVAAVPVSKESQQMGGAMNKVEKEETSSKIVVSLDAVQQESQAAKAAKAAREKELAAVKVDAADCALLAAELELSTKDADRLLREHNGDLSATLKAFVNK